MFLFRTAEKITETFEVHKLSAHRSGAFQAFTLFNKSTSDTNILLFTMTVLQSFSFSNVENKDCHIL